MSDTATAKSTRGEQWRERIAAFEASGNTVRQFCKANGIAEHSFYSRCRRLRQNGPVRFALVERSMGQQTSAVEAGMELHVNCSANFNVYKRFNGAMSVLSSFTHACPTGWCCGWWCVPRT